MKKVEEDVRTIATMSVDEIARCLLTDMEMLRDGEWVPECGEGDDSIIAHCELIIELQRRANGE